MKRPRFCLRIASFIRMLICISFPLPIDNTLFLSGVVAAPVSMKFIAHLVHSISRSGFRKSRDRTHLPPVRRKRSRAHPEPAKSTTNTATEMRNL
ncbi:hypothetical protein QBC45DRAFT_412678 [Copromyces sp. CBS 386.78]|nr:hypothetical protein QBC45DRAFT_412678 [Copromyces sp. CBS 386.78]